MATRNIVPRADNEGGIGTTLKNWATGFIKILNGITITGGANTFNLTNGTASLDVAAGVAVNVDAELHVTAATHLDEAISMSAKAPKANAALTGTTSVEYILTATGTTASLAQNETENILAVIPDNTSYLVFAHGAGNTSWAGCWFVAFRTSGDAVSLVLSAAVQTDVLVSGTALVAKNLYSGAAAIVWSYIRVR